MGVGRQTLGPIEELVLMAVAGLGTNAYGVTIQEDLRKAGCQLDLAPLYTVLKRLESKKLVRSSLGGITADRGGRAKKFYVLTGTGEEAIAAAEATRNRLRIGTWRLSCQQ
jgi:DNA-binding PadR family transcriptional regulator